MNKNVPIKVGIIGCGWAGGTLHLPALKSLPYAEVVAIADIDQHRLSQVGNEHGIKNRYTDFMELLKNNEVEVVAVCVPAKSHAEIAIAALDAGKHTFIEKPLALTMGEIELLIEKANVSPGQATVGFNLRCHRLVREARKMIREGALGKIESIRSTWTSDVRHYRNMPAWRNKREEGGGTLIEIAIHHFDLWRFLLESEVEEVYALTRSLEWDDQIAAVNARMANGAIVSSFFSELTSNNNEIEIHGRKGSLLISCYRFDGLEFQPILRTPGAISARAKKAAKTVSNLHQAVTTMRRGGEFMASFRAEWENFLLSIKNNTPVDCTLQDGMAAVKIALATAQSASLGMPVKVTQAPREIRTVRSDLRIQI
ncbi:MAG TPA: Gfo/Idh/MocA family oxidoreductase [Thermodesulfobacteriota bacterium]|nr:Gfo/Idh/MocA family oxidoreductase [Thermodesulfobacteriota bacterium]